MASFLLLSAATMLPNNPTDQATKAEIGFKIFPCGPCATEEDSLEKYITEVRSIWGDGKDPELPYQVEHLLEKLLISTSP